MIADRCFKYLKFFTSQVLFLVILIKFIVVKDGLDYWVLFLFVYFILTFSHLFLCFSFRLQHVSFQLASPVAFLAISILSLSVYLWHCPFTDTCLLQLMTSCYCLRLKFVLHFIYFKVIFINSIILIITCTWYFFAVSKKNYRIYITLKSVAVHKKHISEIYMYICIPAVLKFNYFKNFQHHCLLGS